MYLYLYICVCLCTHWSLMFMTSFAYEIFKVSREMLGWVLLGCFDLTSSNEDGSSGFVSTKQRGC